jgi:two-component system sensor histidine kinase PilS (NtrC family)
VGARIEDRGSVIYLNDTSDISQQVQQSKLASLGRLTASISHEIRNPLGAISHAAQLLEESESLSSADKRLADIIHMQSNRLNQIIQNVLRLSRKDEVTLERVELQSWLSTFVQEFGEINKLAIDWQQIEVTPASLQVLIDSRHLHQILWNLCSNAIKYGEQKNQTIEIKLVAYVDQRRNTAYMDVIDNGIGVELADQEKLFEPFYTTSITGTGLGLYISRELCLSNGGDLTYSNLSPEGSCFKIRFPEFHL